ncbi:hypothetical protein [Nakamurella sp.]|uniref:hypothetical protein n=1 Tax=Nakamurella sp. TaxID=1869182 RepID=UPI003B3ACA58
MLTPERPNGRRRWLLVTAGLGLAGLVVVTALVALSSDDSSASRASVITPARSSRQAVVASTAPVSTSSSVMLPGGRPDSVLIGGQTNHLEFARLVATALWAYDPSTDFDARNQDLLFASAPAPYGDQARLAQDLAALTSSGSALDSMRKNRTTVTVELTDIEVSVWAANRLAGIGASPGVYGIDVTGEQTITTKGGPPMVVPVQLGLTVACPPATTFCTLDGVLPAHLQDALGSK